MLFHNQVTTFAMMRIPSRNRSHAGRITFSHANLIAAEIPFHAGLMTLFHNHITTGATTLVMIDHQILK